ncbi:transcriptional regulator NrdR [Atopobium deltae]|uniref:Transcriptional repressor NrdR n=1 Tax=Atopobium deltae TaxID=1393034 RepID=A0A133XS94_9ACTN|nr:transcriptional regulator NrdR [Atopobium deltae]KXB33802.1 transcriptional regulator NrdR [Atopobium deltae]
MRCPKCGFEDSRVIDSRPSDNDSIRRRRECEQCRHRFTTYERREETPLSVIKRDGVRELFDRQKLLRGLLTATVKRNIPTSELNNFIDVLESEIRDAGKTEITSSDLGELVLKKLIDLDKVAYVRFASVYRDFKDVEEFSNELRSLSHE